MDKSSPNKTMEEEEKLLNTQHELDSINNVDLENEHSEKEQDTVFAYCSNCNSQETLISI